MEKSVDVLVAGAGVFGLWAAKRAVEAGLSTMIVDPRGGGSGASGGLLGALTAHAPDRWNDKKQFQFDALLELSELIAALEAETGLRTGYRRSGRIMPIRNPIYRGQVESRSEAADRHWRRAETGLVYAARRDAAVDGWLDAAARTDGYVWDALAARISPRRYLDALLAWLAPRADVAFGVAFVDWDGAARLSDGRRIAAGAVVVASGHEAFATLGAMLGRSAADVGGGVKGQSVALRFSPDDRLDAAALAARPLIYEDGVYVIPHDDGSIAVGGTSEKIWSDATSVDPANAAFLERARALCPPLARAEIAEWWAGVRPRARGRDPLVGRLPGAAPIFAMAGGYKISFGVAHRLAQALIEEIAEQPRATSVPDGFLAAHRLG